jgi:hypothetical protein
MATTSTGISVSFNGSTLSEVTALSWSQGGGVPKGRNGSWSDDAGEVSVELLSNPGSISGTRATVSISGGGMGLTVTAVCTRVEARAEVNGVTKYGVTFKIL